jgi:F-type H+-transporting ATPase subunit epsilon
MAHRALTFTIISPERVVFRALVDSVSLHTELGEITVLPHHMPVVGVVKPGEVRIHEGATEHHLATAGGYVQIREGNEVVLLADAAERAEEIDVIRAEAARARAHDLITNRAFANDIEFAALQAALERSLVRIRVSRRRRV